MTKQQLLIADLIAAKLNYTGPMEQLHAMLQLWADAGDAPVSHIMAPLAAPSVLLPDPTPALSPESVPAPSSASEPEASEEPAAPEAFYAPAPAIPDDAEEPLPAPIHDILPQSRLLLDDAVHSVKGFLHLRCKCCGEVRTFCAKHPISEYTCRSCGGITQLSNMTRVKQVCECGSVAVYQTNTDEWYFDLPCISCQNPVAVEYHPAKNRYETIGKNGQRKGRKKK